MGEHGILNKATQAGEAYRKAAAKEKVELMLADFAANRAIGDTKTLEEYLTEQKEQGKIEEVTNNGDGTITVEVDGYEITIREEDLKIIEIGGVKGGIKPEGTAVVTTSGTVAYGGKVEIKVTANIAEGTIVSITATNGATEKDNTFTEAQTVEKLYEVKKNGTYNFTIEGSNGKTKTVSVKVSSIDMPEVTVSVSEIKAKKFTIGVSTTYPEGIVKEYKYYVNGEIVKEGTLDTSYIVENLQPETKYGVYVEACEENGERIKSELQEITTPELPQAGVSEPNNSNEMREAHELPFTWPQIAEIAKMISNNTSITNDTAEFNLVYEGDEYTIGVGDWTMVGVTEGDTTRECKVRIMGFNHDELTNQNAYGGANTYAGMSFEFVDLIMSTQMNSSNSNIGGWRECTLRGILNSTTLDSLENKEYIKEVNKQYIELCNDANSIRTSNDHLWLISVGETFGANEYAVTTEGSRYKFYKLGGSGSKTSEWWLRTPWWYNESTYLRYHPSRPMVGSASGKPYYGVAPGFSI